MLLWSLAAIVVLCWGGYFLWANKEESDIVAYAKVAVLSKLFGEQIRGEVYGGAARNDALHDKERDEMVAALDKSAIHISRPSKTEATVIFRDTPSGKVEVALRLYSGRWEGESVRRLREDGSSDAHAGPP
jgi:hypothetical protein